MPKLICEICKRDISKLGDRCTNRRCLDCHGKWCTPGGVYGPGHGRKWPKEKP